MYEQLIDLAEWGTSEPTLVYCATIWCVPLTKTTFTYLLCKIAKFTSNKIGVKISLNCTYLTWIIS
jgi:hypothetical protein